MSRKPLVVANWKMTMDASSIGRFFERWGTEQAAEGVETVICPSFSQLAHVSAEGSLRDVKVGAQDVFWEEKGAFTGAVSANQLRDAGCEYVILGHSERRGVFGETDAQINAKLTVALKKSLRPIVCVGERGADKEAGRTKAVVLEQLQRCLDGLRSLDMRTVTIAYEPVWAISTSAENTEGKSDTPEGAQVVHKIIRRQLEEWFSAEVAARTRIIYGGSVTPDNAPGFAAMEDIDGALVGGASREAPRFKEIISCFANR